MRTSLFWFVALLLALLGGTALAQPVPATDPVPRVAFPMTSVGNVTTIGPRTADAANAAKFSYGVATNGAVFANTGDRLPTPGGASIPIGVSGTIAKPSVAAALGRFARKTLPVLSVGVALYDLGEELGFGLDNSAGPLVVTRPVAPGPTAWSPLPTFSGDGMLALPTAGCGFSWSTPGYCRTGSLVIGYVDTSTKNALLSQGLWTWQSNDGAMHRVFRELPASLTYPANQPSSVDDFEDAIAAKSGWPTSSALARATLDAIKSGEALQVDPQTVTGPATSPGPVSSTHNATNNTTRLSTTTHNHTYVGPTVSTTTVTNTTVVNNTTQEVISEEETTDSPVTPDKPENPMLCGLPGLPACNVKVDEQGTPDGATANDTSALGTVLDERDAGLETVRDMVDPGDVTWGIVPRWLDDQGCTPWEIFTLPEEAGGEVVVVDLCPLMPISDGILNFIWVCLGIFAVTSMVAQAITSKGT